MPDYEIAIITQSQKQHPYAYEFDKKIEFYDVDISQLNKKVIKGYTFIKNIFRLRKIYTELIHTIKPDIIIVTERGYLDFVIPYILPEIPKLREFHFAKEAVYVHAKLMPFWQRLRHLFVYQFIFKYFNRYDYMVLLTNRDKERSHDRSRDRSRDRSKERSHRKTREHCSDGERRHGGPGDGHKDRRHSHHQGQDKDRTESSSDLRIRIDKNKLRKIAM